MNHGFLLLAGKIDDATKAIEEIGGWLRRSFA
jgi:hypothetical protein